MNYRRFHTALLISCAFSMQQAHASHDAESSTTVQETKRNLFEKLHAVEVKSIAKFLDQKDITHLLASSMRCNSDVRGGNLTTFTDGRVDTIKLDTPEKLNEFLARGMDHLYAVKLNVSVRSEEELRRLLGDPRLQSSLSEITLRYIRPFKGETVVDGLPKEINLAELIVSFQKLKSIRLLGGDPLLTPTEAFELLNNRNLVAFKILVSREPKNLIIKNQAGETLALLAARNGELEFIKFLVKDLLQSIKEKDVEGWNAVHLAAYGGHLPVVQFLAEQVPGSMREKTNDGGHPAYYAAAWKHWDVLMFLAHHDPSTLNMKNNDKKTVLETAKQRGAPQELMLELEALAAAAAAAERDTKSE
jgi:hypothetical protein